MEFTLESHWADPDTNNSDGIRFLYEASSSGTVRFQDTSITECDDAVPNWLGCASGAGTTSWNIWIRADTANYHWCQVNSSTPCWDVQRIGIHEVAHVGGFLADLTSGSETNTIMYNPPTNSATHQIKRCDEAKLQLLYDVASLAGPIADCFDHVTGHGVTGLDTTLTASYVDDLACFGQSLSATGRLGIPSNSSYGVLSSNALAQRVVAFDRRPFGSSTWSVAVSTTTTTSAASGSNWSKAFVVSGTGNVLYEYRAHYAKQTGQGIDEAYSPTFVFAWTDDPDVC